MRRKRLFRRGYLLFLLIFLLLAGCGGKGKALRTIEGDPETQYKKALALFNKRSFTDALKGFDQLKSNFPDSPPFTTWAELKIGDCHFYKKNYVEAIAAYEDFKKSHPTHEEIVYVEYQIAMAYYNQMLTLDRDQSFTKKALTSLENLVANYPPSLFVDNAKEKVGICKKRLADHEIYIGDFYYKKRKFKAAAGRYEGVIAQFPKDPDEDKTLYFLGKSYFELDQWANARTAFSKIAADYPKSPYYKESLAMLDRDISAKERKVSSSKAYLLEAEKKEIAEKESEKVNLVKYQEEGKQTLTLDGKAKEEPKNAVVRDESPAIPNESVGLTSSTSLGSKGDTGTGIEIKPQDEKRMASLPPVQAAPQQTEGSEKTSPQKAQKETQKDAQKAKNKTASKSDSSSRDLHDTKAGTEVKPAEEQRTAALAGDSSTSTPKISTPRVSSPKASTPASPSKRASKEPLKEASKDVSKEKEKPQREMIPGIGDSADRSEPIDITSDRVETFSKENLIIFKGNVMARQKDMVIYADSLEAVIIENGKGIEKVTAGGNVKIQQGLRVANCEKAIFYNIDQKVILTGDPKVLDGDNVVSGEEIVFDIEKNHVEVKGGSTGRSKAKILPGPDLDKLK